MREQDLECLHRLWLDLSADPELTSLHHYHVIGLALEPLKERLEGSQREELIREAEARAV